MQMVRLLSLVAVSLAVCLAVRLGDEDGKNPAELPGKHSGEKVPSQDSGKGTKKAPEQKAFFDIDAVEKKEDEVALKIFNTLVKGKAGNAPGCDSLRQLILAYANSDYQWTAADCIDGKANGNPECKDAPEWQSVNALNNASRESLKKELAFPNGGADCVKLVHLVGSPFNGGMIRGLSPFELALKKPDGWKTGRENMGGSTPQDAAAVKAYNAAKCGAESNPCDKNSLTANARKMFQEAKGRGGRRTEAVTGIKGVCGTVGGIRQKPTQDLKELANFWAADGLGGAVQWDPTDLSADKKKGPNGETFDCSDLAKTLCKDTDKTYDEEHTCAIVEDQKGKDLCKHESQICGGKFLWGPAPQGDTGDGALVKEFNTCNVPWIGGVSGSLMEQLAFAASKGVAMNDEFLLIMLMGLALDCFHSMGEGWSAAKPFLEALKGQQALSQYAQQIGGMKLMSVPAPLSLDGCKPDEGNQDKFIQALEKLVR